jgi:hypothetical protein
LSPENLTTALTSRLARQWQIELIVEGLLIALATKPKETEEELDSTS